MKWTWIAVLLLLTLAWAVVLGTAQGGSAAPADGTLTPQAYLPLVMRGYPPAATPTPTLTPTPAPDWCEPNNAPTEACTVGQGTYRARIASVFDQDWYCFVLSAAKSVAVTLDGPAGDDYDLYLYGNPGGDPLAWSVTPGSADEAVAASLPPGIYYVLVFPITANTTLPYTLTLRW